MRDDDVPPVRWSDYEGHMAAARSDTIAALSTRMSDLMDSASRQGRSHEYIAGIEAALLLAQRMGRSERS